MGLSLITYKWEGSSRTRARFQGPASRSTAQSLGQQEEHEPDQVFDESPDPLASLLALSLGRDRGRALKGQFVTDEGLEYLHPPLGRVGVSKAHEGFEAVQSGILSLTAISVDVRGPDSLAGHVDGSCTPIGLVSILIRRNREPEIRLTSSMSKRLIGVLPMSASPYERNRSISTPGLSVCHQLTSALADTAERKTSLDGLNTDVVPASSSTESTLDHCGVTRVVLSSGLDTRRGKLTTTTRLTVFKVLTLVREYVQRQRVRPGIDMFDGSVDVLLDTIPRASRSVQPRTGRLSRGSH